MPPPGGLKYSTKVGIDAYELARDGHSDSTIAKMLGVSYTAFRRWATTKPDLILFLTRARAWRPQRPKVQDFVFGKLSPKVRDKWERIKQGTPLPDNAEERAEQLTAVPDELEQQYVYVAALVHNGFNHAAACREAKVKPHVVQQEWMRDSEFIALVGELKEARKDFYVECLDALVEKLDSAAVIHVNKTFNRDRGYGDIKTVEMSGKVEHQHSTFDFQPILNRVSLAARREFIEAIEAIEKEREGVSTLPPPSPLPAPPERAVIDAEVISSS